LSCGDLPRRLGSTHLNLALLLIALAAKPLTVSVMPFDNRTGAPEYDVLEKGLAEMLLTDLSAASGLTLVERARLNDLIGELKLQRSALFDPATVQKVGRLAGATHLVTGQLLKVDPELRVDVRLVEVATGKVLFGANVTGKPDRLFELEQELVSRFLDGLGQRGVLAGRSGPKKLETLLAYSQALAQVDDGQLKEASQSLAAVMKTDSEFRLAKERYAEILRRLREAGARREEALSTGEQELLKGIDAALSRPLDYKDHGAVERYLGYRLLRANFALMRLRKVIGEPSMPATSRQVNVVKKSLRQAVRPWLTAYVDGMVQFFDESDRVGNSRAERTPEHERAALLGLGDSADEGWGGTYAYLLVAEFIFEGESRNHAVLRKLAPTPAELEPKLVDKGLALFERALREAATEKSEGQKYRSEIALAHGDALLRLGRREEAMARWQQALDEMPTGPKYKELEERVERTLGVHADWKQLDAATKRCDMSAQMAWNTVSHTLYPFDVEGLFARAEKMVAVCGKKPQQPFFPGMGFMGIGIAAAVVGDCPRYLRALTRAKQVAVDSGKTLETWGGDGCADGDP
jgi:TolB-like protein